MQEEFTIKRVVPLMLKVSDIQPYDSNDKLFPYNKVVTNNVGTISECVSNVTWNVNMQELLGDLYDQYDYFNLELIQIMTVPMTGGNGATFKPFNNGINKGYRTLNIFVSGLQFVRSTFNQKTGNEIRTAHIGTILTNYLAATNFGPYYFLRGDRYTYSGQTGYMNYNLCFKKESNVKLNIRFGGIDTDLDYTPSGIFLGTNDIMHHFSIKFNITPFK